MKNCDICKRNSNKIPIIIIEKFNVYNICIYCFSINNTFIKSTEIDKIVSYINLVSILNNNSNNNDYVMIYKSENYSISIPKKINIKDIYKYNYFTIKVAKNKIRRLINIYRKKRLITELKYLPNSYYLTNIINNWD